MEIKDFPCNHSNSNGINEDVTKNLGLSFPEAYTDAKQLATLSVALKEHDSGALCQLPLDNALEADALGAILNLGDGAAGPRAKEYILTTIEDALNLPAIDFTKGRIAATLEAAEILISQGEQVCIMLNGPIGALSCMIDAGKVFKALRKNRELMKEILWKIGREEFRFIDEAIARGVTIFNWEDPTAAVNIIGPKLAENLVEDFTYPYVKELVAYTKGRAILHLCPKTSFALLGTDNAEPNNIDLPEAMSYGQAVCYMSGKCDLCGLNCLKDTQLFLGNCKFKELVLK